MIEGNLEGVLKSLATAKFMEVKYGVEMLTCIDRVITLMKSEKD